MLRLRHGITVACGGVAVKRSVGPRRPRHPTRSRTTLSGVARSRPGATRHRTPYRHRRTVPGIEGRGRPGRMRHVVLDRAAVSLSGVAPVVLGDEVGFGWPFQDRWRGPQGARQVARRPTGRPTILNPSRRPDGIGPNHAMAHRTARWRGVAPFLSWASMRGPALSRRRIIATWCLAVPPGAVHVAIRGVVRWLTTTTIPCRAGIRAWPGERPFCATPARWRDHRRVSPRPGIGIGVASSASTSSSGLIRHLGGAGVSMRIHCPSVVLIVTSSFVAPLCPLGEEARTSSCELATGLAERLSRRDRSSFERLSFH